MVTKYGLIKKTKLSDFENVRKSGIIAISLKKGDLLKWVKLSSGNDEVIIATANGQSIRFKESQARPMGRGASGVRGIRLKGNDQVSGMNLITKDMKKARILAVMGNGFGKQTDLSEYKVQSRGGSGVRTAKVTPKTGPVIAVHVLDQEEEILALSAKGQIIRTKISEIRTSSRATQGVRIMNLNAGDKLIGVICL